MSRKAKPKKPAFAAVVAGLGEKRAVADVAPTPIKRPATGVATTWNDELPSWRVGLLQVADPFGWHELTGEKLREIREHLANFEKMTWNEISVQGRYQHHSIPVKDIIAPAQRRLRELGLGTVDELFRFRIGNLPRVWGIRDRHVLHVLWWDPNHLICPSTR